jgi:hypothetical protein
LTFAITIYKFVNSLGLQLLRWGFFPSRFPTFPKAWNVTFKLHFWHAPLQALALVASLKLKLWHTCSKSFDLIFVSCDCSLNVSIIVSSVLWCGLIYAWSSNFSWRSWFSFFLLPKGLYVHISLNNLYFS